MHSGTTEKEMPSPCPNHIHERRACGPPVLHVNVLYGLSNEETASNSFPASFGRTTSSGVGALNRAGPVSSLPASAAASASRRAPDGSLSPMCSALSLSAMSGSGAVQSSTLAKPVLDLSQVRCIPLDQWVPDAHVVNCMAPGCSNSFSLFNRKHHCRMCGRVFCSSCCNNLVYIPAAVVNKANSSTEGTAAGSYSATANTSVSSVVTPEPQQFNRACANDGSASPNGMRRGPQAPAAQGLDVSPASSATLFPGPLPVCSDGNGHLPSNALTSPSAVTALPSSLSPSTQAAVPCRVCASCSYEVQLVVSTRQENGEPRRRSRGELKMIQRALLVNVMSFLTLRDLANVSLVSADFYFMSRDNIIWYQYNMTRWVQEAELPRLSSLNSRAAASRMQQQRGPSWYTYSSGSGARSSLIDDMFSSAPVIQDATTLSESEAAKRVISLHARYNYTQFLDFARRQEMARCEGLSSFSLGARLLLSSPIRVALVGPCGIGKTASAHAFLGEKPSQMVVRPTIGFERRAVTVRLARGLFAEAVLHIYDLSGADRYGELRRFVCRHCHAIGLCYDPSRKVTLVQAADIMMGLESALGPQPVVICGLMRQPHYTSSSSSAPLHHHRAGPARLPAVVSAATALNLSAPPKKEDECSHSMLNGGHESCDGLQDDAAVSPIPSPTPPPFTIASPQSSVLEVSVEDAVGITVRGHSSIHCPLLHPTPLFEALVQSVLDLLVEATVASTSTISEISAGLTTHGGGSGPQSFPTCCPSSLSAGSAPASAMRVASTRRRPHASRAIMEDLLNLTMQPCALDILLDRK
ncbi:FYVE zinc finger family protein [Leishmania donovani]|uniref:FYVE zinc finger family protein n=1 Tax=Leishmania donovani TaxID=5661 RepID=A0A504XBH8_LEIDO|nr:FYVE zinc finger family protein [Leishmania donovani]